MAQKMSLGDAVYAAIFAGDLAELERLSLTPNFYRQDNCFALRAAIRSGSIKTLGWFEAAGLATAADCRKCSALHLAACHGHTEVLKWLKARGYATAADCRRDNCVALFAAAANGHINVLDWFEDEGCATAADCSTQNYYALRLAASRGHVKVLDWFESIGCATAAICRAAGVRDAAVLGATSMAGRTNVLEWLTLRGL